MRRRRRRRRKRRRTSRWRMKRRTRRRKKRRMFSLIQSLFCKFVELENVEGETKDDTKCMCSASFYLFSSSWCRLGFATSIFLCSCFLSFFPGVVRCWWRGWVPAPIYNFQWRLFYFFFIFFIYFLSFLFLFYLFSWSCEVLVLERVGPGSDLQLPVAASGRVSWLAARDKSYHLLHSFLPQIHIAPIIDQEKSRSF